MIGDTELQLYDEQKKPLTFSGSSDASALHRVCFAVYNAVKNRGGSPDSSCMSATWLRENPDLTDVEWTKEYVPIGPWIHGSSCIVST